VLSVAFHQQLTAETNLQFYLVYTNNKLPLNHKNRLLKGSYQKYMIVKFISFELKGEGGILSYSLRFLQPFGALLRCEYNIDLFFLTQEY